MRCKAVGVGVGAHDFLTFKIDGVYRGELAGHVIGRFHQLSRPLFMRYGDVASDVAALAKSCEKGIESVRRDGFPYILAFEAVMLQPIIVDERRARMFDWPADDATAIHAGNQSLLRRKESSGRRGNPSIVK